MRSVGRVLRRPNTVCVAILQPARLSGGAFFVAGTIPARGVPCFRSALVSLNSPRVMYSAVPSSAAEAASLKHRIVREPKVTLLQGPAEADAKCTAWQLEAEAGRFVMLNTEAVANHASAGGGSFDDSIALLPAAPSRRGLRALLSRARKGPARVLAAVTAYLLPYGFPRTVAPSYASYASWTFAGMLFSSAGGVLSTQSLLYAIGVGAGAVPLAAALNWVLKDGLGQLGGVLSAALINNRFDSDPKRWRFLSALAQDASTLLEILTPLMPGAFLPLAAVANVGKNVSWLSASATRAGIHSSLAIHGNLADVTGKAGSQTIAASTLGMLLGVVLSPAIGSDPRHILIAFMFCSAAHLTCVFTALRKVVLPTLSSRRLALAASPFFTLVADTEAALVAGSASASVAAPAAAAAGATAAGSADEVVATVAAASAAAGSSDFAAASASAPSPRHCSAMPDDGTAGAHSRVLSPAEAGGVEVFTIGPITAALSLLQRVLVRPIAGVVGCVRRCIAGGGSGASSAAHKAQSMSLLQAAGTGASLSTGTGAAVAVELGSIAATDAAVAPAAPTAAGSAATAPSAATSTASSAAAGATGSGILPAPAPSVLPSEALTRVRARGGAALALDHRASALVDVGPSLACGWDGQLLEFASASGAETSKYVVAVWRPQSAAAAAARQSTWRGRAASAMGLHSTTRARSARVQLLLLQDACWRDALVGYLHAHYVARALIADATLLGPVLPSVAGSSAAVAGANAYDLGVVRAGAAFALAYGDRLVQDLEAVGWWVGQPLLERDYGTRLRMGAAVPAAQSGAEAV